MLMKMQTKLFIFSIFDSRMCVNWSIIISQIFIQHWSKKFITKYAVRDSACILAEDVSPYPVCTASVTYDVHSLQVADRYLFYFPTVCDRDSGRIAKYKHWPLSDDRWMGKWGVQWTQWRLQRWQLGKWMVERIQQLAKNKQSRSCLAGSTSRCHTPSSHTWVVFHEQHAHAGLSILQNTITEFPGNSCRQKMSL